MLLRFFRKLMKKEVVVSNSESALEQEKDEPEVDGEEMKPLYKYYDYDCAVYVYNTRSF